jgi:hypothetical protein
MWDIDENTQLLHLAQCEVKSAAVPKTEIGFDFMYAW